MTKNKNSKHEEGLREVEQALTKTEQFLENHLNLVLYIIAGVIVVVLGFLGVQKFIIAPKNIEAQEQMFPAQDYFSKDSFDLAVNGDGVTLGLLDIIEEYGSTNAGNLANYYTGISYLHLGEYDLAIEYLGKFDTDDMLIEPLAKAAIGDAYVELENYSKAISAYKGAMHSSDNSFTTPTILIKLAAVYEASGEIENAIESLEKVKNDYPKSTEASNVEKTIARLKQ